MMKRFQGCSFWNGLCDCFRAVFTCLQQYIEKETLGSLLLSPDAISRGVRRTYQNPLYNHAADRPLSPPPASLLPIDHPEYSPPIHCTPKLLFPAAHRNLRSKNARKTAAAPRARSPSFSGDELEGDERESAGIRPQKLDFGKAEHKDDKKKDGKKPRAQRVQTLDQELKAAGDDVFL
jgi:hypothetical protein